MPAKLERIERHPGIFKRGSRYVATFYDAEGKQRKRSFRTLGEAVRFKRGAMADRDRGEADPRGTLTFGEFAADWIETYQGRRAGFRETTREDYRRELERYGYPFFGKLVLTAITPRDVYRFVGWLTDSRAQAEHAHTLAKAKAIGKRPPKALDKDARRELSDSTVRNAVAPIRAALQTAVEIGLIRSNPAVRVRLPNRPRIVDDEEIAVRALTREQLDAFLRVLRPSWRLFFELLASTGLRWSEAVALQWKHIETGTRPRVKVRRRYYHGFEPPKSRYGRRDVPIERTLARALGAVRDKARLRGDDDLVFPNSSGGVLDYSNTLKQIVRPAMEEAGASWAGLHALRHTAASLLFERGANAVQVQRWLGHHSAAFTLSRYVHLLSEDLGEPLSLSQELAGGNVGGKVTSPDATQTHPTREGKNAYVSG